jgi:regulator of protease activity HflC (stomatin/prohibitin superfamily)
MKDEEKYEQWYLNELKIMKDEEKYEQWYLNELKEKRSNKMNLFEGNKKYIIGGIIIFVIIFIIIPTIFKRVKIDPGCEGVIVSQPYIFTSTGGLKNYTLLPGSHWTWRSNEVYEVSTQPNQAKEPFTDIISADSIPVEFDGFFNYYITEPIQRIKLGDNWYTSNIQQTFKTLVRDECKKYKMTSLISDRETVVSIEKNVFDSLEKHIITTKLPIKLTKINIGKINPTEAVMKEIAATAVQQQRQRTQTETKLAEDKRKATEVSKAAADNAYREAMHLDPAQFIQLEALRTFAEAALDCAKSNSCMMVLTQPGSANLTLPQIHHK